MYPDPFFRPDLSLLYHSLAKFQRTCPWSGAGGFCGARIHPECLRIGKNSSVRVGLCVPAAEWFATLSQLGELMQMSRNEVAVMGQLGTLPELLDWRNPVLPRDKTSTFMPNLTEHASLWALRAQSSAGVVYGFEVRNVSDQAFQRLFLTSTAGKDLFERFVTEHQSPPQEVQPWFAPNHRAGIQRRDCIVQRIPYLRSLLTKGTTLVRQLPVGVLPCLLMATGRSGFPISTVHYSNGLIRTSIWTPTAVAGEDAQPVFMHGQGAGLQINLSSVSGIWLWEGRCVCCDRQHWTIVVGDAADAVGLTLTAGYVELEKDWRNLIRHCLS